MKNVVVKIESDVRESCERAFAIFKDRIASRCDSCAVEGSLNAAVILTVDRTLPPEGFRIDEAGGGVRVSGGTPLGLLYGVGKFLRTSGYGDEFQPSTWRGTSVPQCEVRGVYFASHFHNWYQVASEEELTRYVEDIALWGANTTMAIFPFIDLTGWDDAEAEPAIRMLRSIAKTSHALGLKFATILYNVLFKNHPEGIAATPVKDPLWRRGNFGYPICPSDKKGREYILENARTIYERLADVGIDYLTTWPYDEGGCGCDKCIPWGSNGFYSMSRELAQLGRAYFPNLKIIMSTWLFDTPPEGEWQGVAQSLAESNDWLDFILADSHEDFPSYPLEHDAPGKLPLLNFPEISMWGLDPWGGFGATPLPRRFQRLWNQAKHKLQGGFPYSEGIFEDINKVVVEQFYWDKNRTAEDTLREYVAYEYSPAVSDGALKLISLLEVTHVQGYRARVLEIMKTAEPSSSDQWKRVIFLLEADLKSVGARLEVDISVANAARTLAKEINARVPNRMAKAWRWRILYLRALLEPARLTPDGLTTEEARTAMRELIEIFHCRPIDDGSDIYHTRVRPPLREH